MSRTDRVAGFTMMCVIVMYYFMYVCVIYKQFSIYIICVIRKTIET